MSELSKKLLNYYATFTETKFNFSRLITYRWSDDELSLDFGIYPEFTNKLLESATTEDTKSITVKKGQYVVTIKADAILAPIMDSLKNDYSVEFLERCINDSKDTKRTFNVDKDGNAAEGEQSADSTKKQSFEEGTRAYNLALRKRLDDIVTIAHKDKIDHLKKDRNINITPGSTFNQRGYTQRFFDALQEIASKSTDARDYFDKANAHFEKNVTDVTIYDLYYNLYAYMTYVGMGTLYAFFHALKGDKYNFPLYFMELELRSNPNEDEVDEISFCSLEDIIKNVTDRSNEQWTYFGYGLEFLHRA